MCKKSQSNLLASTCGCKYCEDCLYELVGTITEGQIILNGYEALQLSINDIDKCPNCEKSINLNNIVLHTFNIHRIYSFSFWCPPLPLLFCFPVLLIKKAYDLTSLNPNVLYK